MTRKGFNDQDVLQQIMTAFWQHGYYHTSVQDLEAATGINKQSLYNTFGDKHRLFLESLSLYHDTVIKDRLFHIRADDQRHISAIDTLTSLLTGAYMPTGSPLGCFAVNTVSEFSLTDPEVTAALTRFFTDFTDLLASVVLRVQAESALTNGLSARALAEQLMAIRNGLQNARRLGASLDKVTEIAQQSVRLMQVETIGPDDTP